LGQYMRENLWEPLGMSDTSFVVPGDQASRYARPLSNDPATGQPQAVPMRLQKPKFECGGGCAASTAGDYLRFVSMLVNKGQLGGKCRARAVRGFHPDRRRPFGIGCVSH